MNEPFVKIELNEQTVAKVQKYLDKWQGKPLAIRTERAMLGGAMLFVGPVRLQARRHNRTGATQRGYAARRLPKKRGENAAFGVASNTKWRHFAITGTSRGVRSDPYVGRVEEQLGRRVIQFVQDEIRRLA